MSRRVPARALGEALHSFGRFVTGRSGTCCGVREGRLAGLTCLYLYVAVFLLSSQETSMVQEWFSKDLWEQYWANLGVTAENGCFYRWGKATWESLTDELDFSWKERARKLLRMYTDRLSEPRRRHRVAF